MEKEAAKRQDFDKIGGGQKSYFVKQMENTGQQTHSVCKCCQQTNANFNTKLAALRQMFLGGESLKHKMDLVLCP
jgi:hypothetical protein